MQKKKTLFVSFNRSWVQFAGTAFGVAFLNLITVGLYKPYGITRVRRRLYNSIFVGADALQYSGDAKGLSRVTFYPSLAFLLILFVPAIVQFMVSFEAAVAIGVLQTLLIVIYYQYLARLQRQYELNNISWRGQGFAHVPSDEASWPGYLLPLLNVFTLGLVSPWLRVWRARRDYGQLYYGRTRMVCALSAGPLLGLYILGWLASLIGFYVAARYLWNESWSQVWFIYQGGTIDPATAPPVDASMFGGDVPGATDPQALAEMGVYMKALFLPFSVYPMWVSWRLLCLCFYEAAYWRQLADTLELGEFHIRFEGGPLGLAILSIISFNLNYWTANLSRPFTTFSKIRYFCRRLLVDERLQT